MLFSPSELVLLTDRFLHCLESVFSFNLLLDDFFRSVFDISEVQDQEEDNFEFDVWVDRSTEVDLDDLSPVFLDGRFALSLARPFEFFGRLELQLFRLELRMGIELIFFGALGSSW